MVNHFKSEAAAEVHLVSKGFKEIGNHWVSADGLIDAWLVTDIHRGTYIQFIA